MSYEIFWLNHGAYIRYGGRTGVDEVASYAREAQADVRFDDLHFVLNDFRACSGFEFDAQRVEQLAASDRGASLTRPNICIVVVTDRPDVRAFVDAYRAVGLNTFPIEVFDRPEDAEACVERILTANADVSDVLRVAQLLRTVPPVRH